MTVLLHFFFVENRMYKGPMKEVLDSMAKCLRSTEDAENVRAYTKEKIFQELMQRKSLAESMIEKLEAENSALKEKYYSLGTVYMDRFRYCFKISF